MTETTRRIEDFVLRFDQTVDLKSRDNSGDETPVTSVCRSDNYPDWLLDLVREHDEPPGREVRFWLAPLMPRFPTAPCVVALLDCWIEDVDEIRHVEAYSECERSHFLSELRGPWLGGLRRLLRLLKRSGMQGFAGVALREIPDDSVRTGWTDEQLDGLLRGLREDLQQGGVAETAIVDRPVEGDASSTLQEPKHCDQAIGYIVATWTSFNRVPSVSEVAQYVGVHVKSPYRWKQFIEVRNGLIRSNIAVARSGMISGGIPDAAVYDDEFDEGDDE